MDHQVSTRPSVFWHKNLLYSAKILGLSTRELMHRYLSQCVCSGVHSACKPLATDPIHLAPVLSLCVSERAERGVRNHPEPSRNRISNVINPILRGWVRYIAVGDASRCFGFIKDWVEKKVRRHLRRARQWLSFGWKRWRRQWRYQRLGLCNNYRVQRLRLKALPT
jgi:Group II intron, maturase-specific domain